MRKLGISEIIKLASEQKTKEEKVAVLRNNNSSALQTVLKFALDPTVKWALPPGEPPYKPIPYLDQQSMLYSEARRLYLFIEGGNPNLTPIKRESLFIGLLESIDPEDAKLLVSIKDKKLPSYGPFKGLSAATINEAFPGLINGQVKA
jgi:hypothetical protein